MRPIWWCLLDQYVTRVQKQICCRLTISPCCYLWSTKVILPSTESREMNSLLLLPMMSEQFGALVTWSRPMATRQQWLFPWSSSCWTPAAHTDRQAWLHAAHTDRQAWLHAGKGNTWHPDILYVLLNADKENIHLHSDIMHFIWNILGSVFLNKYLSLMNRNRYIDNSLKFWKTIQTKMPLFTRKKA